MLQFQCIIEGSKFPNYEVSFLFISSCLQNSLNCLFIIHLQFLFFSIYTTQHIIAHDHSSLLGLLNIISHFTRISSKICDLILVECPCQHSQYIMAELTH